MTENNRPVSRIAGEASTPDGGALSGLLASSGRLWIGRGILLFVLLAGWQLSAGTLFSPRYISRPTDVAARLGDWISSGFILQHFGATVQAMVLAFILGAMTGVAAGFALGRSRALDRVVSPVVMAIYGLPKIALAPLFIVWFGISLQQKVAYAAVIVFFLVFWNAYGGARDVDTELEDVIKVMGGSRRDVILKVVLPNALVWVFAGLRLSIPYALIGVVVAEMIGSRVGLGYLAQYTAANFDSAGIFAVLLILMFIAVCLHLALAQMQARMMHWKAVSDRGAGAGL
ncbi:MAG: ABC transporter permease [Chloroflexi bacterium]|nr:ABC transporter permease [Chloroflexota bacterium]